MIPGIVLFSIAAIFGAGWCFATGHFIAMFGLAAVGGGWLGIVYATQYRLIQESRKS